MRVRVDEVMNRDAACVTPETPFKEIAKALVDHQVNAIPVVDEDRRVVGVVSEADLLPREEFREQLTDGNCRPSLRTRLRWRLSPGRHPLGRIDAGSAAELMTAPAITVRPEHAAMHAMRLMDERGVVCLPVVDAGNRPVGVVSRRDLVKVFLRPDERIGQDVEAALAHLACVDTSRVAVAVTDGVVTLDGWTRTRVDATFAARAAARVNGVVGIHDELLWTENDA